MKTNVFVFFACLSSSCSLPQISQEDNENLSPVTEAVNTVSRFGKSLTHTARCVSLSTLIEVKLWKGSK